MVKDICKDVFFLKQVSERADSSDAQTANDLVDTLNAHREECVGMAANMIGVSKRIIVFSDAGVPVVMVNPVIIKKSGEYETEEGCLSLTGVRKVKRYRSIKVEYEDGNFKKRIKTFEGFTAQIIQHEVDHCDGVIV